LRPFSIHKRIEGGATSATLQPGAADSSFSIHKRIEGGATQRHIRRNFVLNTFSIHKRIEGGATSYKTIHRVFVKYFQYPQADRRGCNPWCARPFRIAKTLSVSTSGSKGVQRTLTADNTYSNYPFSIHKRIEGGATVPGLSANHCAGAFQYPQADRRGCNSHVTR